MEKVAIIKLSAMGDIIHSMVALEFIKKYYPSIKIDWFVEDAFSQVLEYNPNINKIIKLNLKSIKKSKKNIFSQISFIKAFKEENYDLIIDAQGLIKSALVARILGKNIVGFCKNSTRERFASFFYTKKVSIAYDKNVIERNCFLISKALNFDISTEDILNKKPFLFFKSENKVVYDFLSKDKKNVLLIVGASWKSKMYSKEKFAKIASNIDENFIIAWGNEEEKSIASFISDNSSAKVLPKIDLNSLKALVSKVDLVIGNDTGPTHMAWALNTPSITIFGNTPDYRNTYLTNINRTVKSKSFVNPFKLNKEDFSINEINEQEIIKIAKELLCIE